MISAKLQNRDGRLDVTLSTNDTAHMLEVPPKPGGRGSSANGGELLFLALAACYCNDIYREAGQRQIEVTGVEVEVSGEFGAAGEPARGVTYRVRLRGNGSEAELRALAEHTDSVAEIQNTVRNPIPVTLSQVEVEPARDGEG